MGYGLDIQVRKFLEEDGNYHGRATYLIEEREFFEQDYLENFERNKKMEANKTYKDRPDIEELKRTMADAIIREMDTIHADPEHRTRSIYYTEVAHDGRVWEYRIGLTLPQTNESTQEKWE